MFRLARRTLSFHTYRYTSTSIMPKRTSAPNSNASAPSEPPKKKTRTEISSFSPNKIATQDNADAVHADPPFHKLVQLVEEKAPKVEKGSCVIYWMRMGDLRVSDNRALSRASKQASEEGLPLVVIFIISPQDYTAHDRSARRIDFLLRNLRVLKTKFSELHIPFHTLTLTPRKSIPSCVVSLFQELGANRVFANMEYEVDELRRDLKVFKDAKDAGIYVSFHHDKCIVEPGVCETKQGKTYTVFSPYQKTWLNNLNGNIPHYLENCSDPSPNNESIRQDSKLGTLFETEIPPSVDGFELEPEMGQRMREAWPEGEETAHKMLERFLYTKARSCQIGLSNPLEEGAENSDKKSRIREYGQKRDFPDKDTSSRLSPYLASGVISVRQCVRETMKLLGIKKVDGSRETSVGRWVQELAWRDFYVNILVEHPRVSMGRPFNENYADVVWEVNGEMLQAWKDGKTGVPIVDAGMRQLKEMGWMHNRLRMITAMFLTKDLMIDWRLGERYFSESLIDADLASNNGGWQWSASTGTDASPYFRIMNPYTQSEKVDPTGEYIRHFVPELRKVRGPEIHKPSAALADKLGYPRPIVDHAKVRERAIRRYKEPGEE